MRELETHPIDVVITWVDGSDREWLKQKQQYNPDIDVDASIVRYRDFGTLKYVFRSIEKFAPWVRNIFLVTNGQVPSWLNIGNEKLRLVKHSDFMPDEYLPTFSANPIEWNLHKIEGLSENFIYFNDDMLLSNYVDPCDFFQNDLPCDTLALGLIRPNELFSYLTFNNMFVLNKNFNFRTTFKQQLGKFLRFKYGKRFFGNLILGTRDVFYGMFEPHVALAMKKKYFELLWNKEYEAIVQTCKNRFRSKNDITIWLIRYWQLLTGNFVPRSIKFGRYFSIHSFINDPKAINAVKKGKYKAICLNDAGEETADFAEEKRKFEEIFDTILGEKSTFEI